MMTMKMVTIKPQFLQVILTNSHNLIETSQKCLRWRKILEAHRCWYQERDVSKELIVLLRLSQLQSQGWPKKRHWKKLISFRSEFWQSKQKRCLLRVYMRMNIKSIGISKTRSLILKRKFAAYKMSLVSKKLLKIMKLRH